MPTRLALPLLPALLSLAACHVPRPRAAEASLASTVATEATREGSPDDEAARRAVAAVLDDWHLAASQADGARYFGHMAEDAVFLGTDATERWTLAAFRGFCDPYFAKGSGWTYECRERHVFVEGTLAWFDERLWNDKYGDCRGTGVLRLAAGEWRIVHYSLGLPIPNERAADVVKLIRGS